MSIAIIIATYGEPVWEEMAEERALPSARDQGADEVLCDHFPHATIAQARNILAARSTSDWLCFLDADDELSPGYIAAMKREIMRRRSASPTFLDSFLLNPKVSYVVEGRARPAKFLRTANLQDDNYLIVGTVIQRWLFERVGGFSDYPHGFEDWSLWAKAWKDGAKIVQVHGATYIAYVNPNSKHRTAWKDKTAQAAMHHQVRRELFPELYELDTP